MHLQLIRSATLRLEYAGQTILIDPYLAAKHTRPSMAGKSLNPLVDLPCPPEEVIAGVDLCLISHLHSDHFDPAAQQLLPRSTPILCQPGDAHRIKTLGFTRVQPVTDALTSGGITFTRTLCQHGSGAVLAEMGAASGFVLQAAGEPTVYWCGDTIFFDPVGKVIARFQPEIIITHSCGAVWGEGVLIVMDAAQTVQVCQAGPASRVVAVHMEALDHATVNRAQLRAAGDEAGISRQRLLIPADGERLAFRRAERQPELL